MGAYYFTALKPSGVIVGKRLASVVIVGVTCGSTKILILPPRIGGLLNMNGVVFASTVARRVGKSTTVKVQAAVINRARTKIYFMHSP